ncbi:hypothetical protein [Nocardioides conyzicola]|uniref:Fibronectin type III domain-containing protein n=1 Tax=Nocardioides conyzicola TaxID=1651781 RepID=A0ABP8XB14_9ACTN
MGFRGSRRPAGIVLALVLALTSLSVAPGTAADPPPPGNDDRADAEVVTPGTVGTTVTDVEPDARWATEEPDDPAFPCRSGAPGPGYGSVWYRIAPTVDTRVRISTAGSDLEPPGGPPDTLVAVYSDGELVGCNDDIDAAADQYLSTLTVGIDAGSTYDVVVSQWEPVVPEESTGSLVTSFTWLDGSDSSVVVGPHELELEKGGAPATYSVRLSQSPADDVTVHASSSVGCDTVPTTLTFTPADYATPQTVTVSPTDAGTCMITHTAASTDPAYDHLAVAQVTATVLEPLHTDIVVATPADGAHFTRGQVVLADYACTDNRGGAGIVSCVGPIADGAAIDTATVGTHSFAVTVTEVGGGTHTVTQSYGVVAPPVVGRPDARLKVAGRVLGNDVYGSPGKRQSWTTSTQVGNRALAVVSLQNDAGVADALALRGGGSARGFQVRYLSPSGRNLTAAVTKGTFRTPRLAPGATYDVRVLVTVTNRAKRAKALATVVTVRSGAWATAKDVVRVVTRRK